MWDVRRPLCLCFVFVFLNSFFVVPVAAEIGTKTPEKATAINWIEKNKSTYDEVAIYIWEHPELAFIEFKSAAKLQQYLRTC
jgi:hypothetical protein